MQDASEWDLKRKLLTRGFLTAFHQAGQEQCVLQVSISVDLQSLDIC
jgi:hypothetical protein